MKSSLIHSMSTKIQQLVLVSILFFSSSSLFGGENEKNVKTKPEKINLYLQGAQIYRNQSVSLQSGINKIIFEGLEAGIDPQSIQVGGKGNFTISDIQSTVYYPELEQLKNSGDSKFTKALKMLQDSIHQNDLAQEELQNKREVLTIEKNVMLNYKLYKGDSRKDSIPYLKDGLSYLRERLNNIYAELFKLKREEEKMIEIRQRLNKRIAEIQAELGKRINVNGEESKPDYRIIITVITESGTNALFNLNYYVSQAGWHPIYDLRTDGVESPVKLTYKAQIYQNTGANWEQVNLTLSTGNPHQHFQVPVLNPWYIDFQRPQYGYRKKSKDDWARSTTAPSVAMDEKNLPAEGKAEEMGNYDAEANYSYQFTEVDDQLVQTEFEIKLPYTIPSDNKPHIVSVMNKELPTTYVHKAIPKLDVNAYLTARVTGWEDLNLIPGEASIFFDGSFVGKTMINTESFTDTLELSMGQDKSVSIKRVRLKDKIKEKIIDNHKIYTFAYDIQVKNGNAKTIDLEILDQVPLSSNKNIVIEKENLSGGVFQAQTGEVKWKMQLKSKDSKKIAFSYTVKTPKETTLSIR